MKKLRQALQNQRGETIVEVLVAFVLLIGFLLIKPTGIMNKKASR